VRKFFEDARFGYSMIAALGRGFDFGNDFVAFKGATMNYRFWPMPQPDPETVSAINFINP
jgi:hypothetical protein